MIEPFGRGEVFGTRPGAEIRPGDVLGRDMSDARKFPTELVLDAGHSVVAEGARDTGGGVVKGAALRRVDEGGT